MMHGHNHRNRSCCDIELVCGHSIYEGVVFVGVATVALSILVLLSSAVSLSMVAIQSNSYIKDPVVAMNLMFALVGLSTSTYQFIISVLLLWQVLKLKGDIFLLSIWFVSHLSLLGVYMVLFITKVVICVVDGHILSAVLTACAAIVYAAVIVYFCLIVNSYIISLERDRYF